MLRHRLRYVEGYFYKLISSPRPIISQQYQWFIYFIYFFPSNPSNRLRKHHKPPSSKLRLYYPFWIRTLDTPTFDLLLLLLLFFIYFYESDPILLLWVRVMKLELRIKHIHFLSHETKHCSLGQQGWLWIM